MPTPSKRELATLQRHNRLSSLIEKPYARAIVKEKNSYVESISATYEKEGLIKEFEDRHIENIKEINSFYNNKIISVFAADTQRETLKSNQIIFEQKQELYDKWLNTVIGLWLNNHTALQAVQIAETTTQDIREAIEKAVEREELRPQVAKTILKVKGFSAFRAEMIARTETHNAAMYANKESGIRLARETGEDLLKVWIPAQDHRTRDSHAAMKKHDPISMDAKFSVGGDKMDRPGDPAGSARNVIHCRCTLAYRVAE